MTEVARDARGVEHKLPIASEDLTLVDAIGVPRKVLAGTAVPFDLLEAYKAQVSGEVSDEPAPDVESLNREQLDQVAEKLGVVEPDKLANKGAVLEAIAGHDDANVAAAVKDVVSD